MSGVVYKSTPSGPTHQNPSSGGQESSHKPAQSFFSGGLDNFPERVKMNPQEGAGRREGGQEGTSKFAKLLVKSISTHAFRMFGSYQHEDLSYR